MSNFVPNEIMKIKPRDPPWISKAIKSMLNKQNRIYGNYKKHGYNQIEKVRLDAYSDMCNKVISKAKTDYLNLSGSKLSGPNTGQKIMLEDN